MLHAAISQEIFRPVILVSFAWISIVVDIQVVGIAQRYLPQYPALSGFDVPQMQPFTITIEAARIDRSRSAGVPPMISAILVHDLIIIGIPIQGVTYQYIIGQACHI